MNRLGYRLATLAILLGLTGCGGGIQEGIPPNAGQLTPEQQKAVDALVAQEEADAKAAPKGKRGP